MILLLIAFTFLRLPAADLSVDIVPESSGGKNKQDINFWHSFYVVLTNNSGHSLVVWEDACSWGYFNLSFEFTDAKGRVIKVERDPREDFTMNAPMGYLLLPGRHFVFPIQFGDRDQKDISGWTHTDKLEWTMTVKAIYKNTNAPFPGQKPDTIDRYLKPGEPAILALLHQRQRDFIELAWIGRVESEPIKVTILR
jgi:hypothetical protein